MRNAAMLFKPELTRSNRCSMMPNLSGFMGMVEQDPKSVYDLLLSTPGKTDSESDSEGSCHPVRKCNMLHLLDNGVAIAKGEEDDTYLIPRTPREQGSMSKSV
jgi:hypothetical protein